MLNSTERNLDFREIAEAPRLKKAWAITHPSVSEFLRAVFGSASFLAPKFFVVPKQTSKKFASEGFGMEISTPNQLLRS